MVVVPATAVVARLTAANMPAAVTVTTFGGDPKLATSDPSNTTGLVMVILLTLLIIGGAALLYLRHRRPRQEAGSGSPATSAGDPQA